VPDYAIHCVIQPNSDQMCLVSLIFAFRVFLMGLTNLLAILEAIFDISQYTRHTGQNAGSQAESTENVATLERTVL